MKKINENKSVLPHSNNSGKILLSGVLLFAALLILSFIIDVPSQLHAWTSGWYAMDYSLGFGSRLMVGSFLKLIYPDFLFAEDAYHFVIIVLIILLAVLLLLWAYVLYKASSDTIRNGLALLIILYLANPGSVAYLWSEENFGRFDTYLFLFTIAGVFLWLKAASYPVRCLIVLLFGSICLAIHQVFIFLYAPVIFVMLVLPLDFGTGRFRFRELDEKSRQHLLLGMTVLLLLCAQFLYYQFGASLNISSTEELVAVLSSKTNLPVMENALYFEYYSTTEEMISAVVLNELGERIRYTFIALFLLSPIFFLYGYLWCKIIKTENKTSERIKYILMPLSLCTYIIAFALAKDWGRWTSAFMIVLLLQIIMVAMIKKEAVSAAFLSLNGLAHKLRIPLVIYIFAIALLEKYQCILLPQAPDIFTFFYRIFHALFRS